jgi:hypothetical protein
VRTGPQPALRKTHGVVCPLSESLQTRNRAACDERKARLQQARGSRAKAPRLVLSVGVSTRARGVAAIAPSALVVNATC